MHQLGLRHLYYLTDDFSIWQHTKEDDIDKQHGYALDDAARALLAAVTLKEFELARTYLSFIELACSRSVWANFFRPDRTPIKEKPPTQDALGEVIWALGQANRVGFEQERVGELFEQLRPEVANFRYVRSEAYALLGALELDADVAEELQQKILHAYMQQSTAAWPWLESTLSYANAIIPYALLQASQRFFQASVGEVGIQMLEFLNKETRERGVPIAIGCDGWYPQGGSKSLYDQQPIDICYQILANCEAYSMTGEMTFLHEARDRMDWFFGNNIEKVQVVDLVRESVHDAIIKGGVNPNQGSENIVCYLYAQAVYLETAARAMAANQPSYRPNKQANTGKYQQHYAAKNG
jgi:hypothetical protein